MLPALIMFAMVLLLVAIFATTKKGTGAIVLGLFLLSGSINMVGHASSRSTVFSFAFAGIALLWGITDKLVARFPVPPNQHQQTNA
jgi:hypothetical protein